MLLLLALSGAAACGRPPAVDTLQAGSGASSEAFVRVAKPMVIVPDVAVLESAPAEVSPTRPVPVARQDVETHGTLPAGAVEQPGGVAFGLYTWLDNVRKRPAFVFTYTLPSCQASGDPVGASRRDCTASVVVDDADGHVINTITTGGPA